MSGAEQLLLLFDEAIKRLIRAEQSLKDKNYGDFEDCLKRTTRIIRYLTDILDMNYPISRDLRRIYIYLVYDLSVVSAEETEAGSEETETGRGGTETGRDWSYPSYSLRAERCF